MIGFHYHLNPACSTDGYKTGHHLMYVPGVKKVYINFTPRNVNRMPAEAKSVVVFAVNLTLKYINDLWANNFFLRKKEEVCGEAKEYLSNYLGMDYDVTHFEKLHDLGYLPIKVKALPEGSVVEAGIPILTVVNTIDEFYWVPNFLETLISDIIWKPIHSASIALAYKKVLLKGAQETAKDSIGFVDFQGHDFSFRGMQSLESAVTSGMGWLTSFKGTDTIPALQGMKYYYGSSDVGYSVLASEHSVMTSYGEEDEIEGFRNIIDMFPKGIVSLVSDQFDLWQVVTKFLPLLKDKIMSRDGKIVIRPDSGNPVDILCGNGKEVDAYNDIDGREQCESKGLVELLWDIFGGTVNEQGYKVLDPHIGAIYGDAITLERASQIIERLKAKGFASTNVVFGVGSYSLGYATRDNQGGAVKATYIEIEKDDQIICRDIYKDPKTDSGLKKSARGLLQVYKEGNTFKLKDRCTKAEEAEGLLREVFVDSKFIHEPHIDEIRQRILDHINS